MTIDARTFVFVGVRSLRGAKRRSSLFLPRGTFGDWDSNSKNAYPRFQISQKLTSHPQQTTVELARRRGRATKETRSAMREER